MAVCVDSSDLPLQFVVGAYEDPNLGYSDVVRKACDGSVEVRVLRCMGVVNVLGSTVCVCVCVRI